MQFILQSSLCRASMAATCQSNGLVTPPSPSDLFLQELAVSEGRYANVVAPV